MENSKASRIKEYQAANPAATPMQIAAALGVNVSYVYWLRQQIKKKMQKAQKATKPVPPPLQMVVVDKASERIKELESSLQEAATIIQFYEKRLFTNLYR